jgi:hypothetical protein
LSEGDSVYSQPEKARRQRLSLPWTSSWTKAPVSFSLSHGAVVSQASSRTVASFRRTDWPGLRVKLRTIPLRLFNRPITATRSAIGVSAWSVPAGAAWLAARPCRWSPG